MSTFTRTLEVPGTFNFRDLGGYSAREGRTTKPGVFYRSGALQDLRPLASLGIRTVVDLRGHADVTRDSGPLGALQEQQGVRRVASPLVPALVDGLSGYEHLNRRFGRGISAGRYGGYLDLGLANVREIFGVLTDPNAFPAVVHCTAGKDRTGVIVALVLDLVGVNHETIVADYALSNAAIPHLVAHFHGETVDPNELSESDLAGLGAPREAMAGFLAHLESEYGSARDFLQSAGVDPVGLSALESVLLADLA